MGAHYIILFIAFDGAVFTIFAVDHDSGIHKRSNVEYQSWQNVVETSKHPAAKNEASKTTEDAANSQEQVNAPVYLEHQRQVLPKLGPIRCLADVPLPVLIDRGKGHLVKGKVHDEEVEADTETKQRANHDEGGPAAQRTLEEVPHACHEATTAFALSSTYVQCVAETTDI